MKKTRNRKLFSLALMAAVIGALIIFAAPAAFASAAGGDSDATVSDFASLKLALADPGVETIALTNTIDITGNIASEDVQGDKVITLLSGNYHIQFAAKQLTADFGGRVTLEGNDGPGGVNTFYKDYTDYPWSYIPTNEAYTLKGVTIQNVRTNAYVVYTKDHPAAPHRPLDTEFEDTFLEDVKILNCKGSKVLFNEGGAGLYLTNCILDGNEAIDVRAGNDHSHPLIRTNGTLVIRDSQITNNIGIKYGAVYFSNNGTFLNPAGFTMRLLGNTVFTGNQTTGDFVGTIYAGGIQGVETVIEKSVTIGEGQVLNLNNHKNGPVTVQEKTIYDGQTAAFGATVLRGDISVQEGYTYTIARDDGVAVGTKPNSTLPGPHKYTLKVYYDGVYVSECFIIVDARKPQVVVTGLQKRWNDDDFQPYASSTWTNAVIKANVAASLEPLYDYQIEYWNADTNHWLVATPTEWTAIEGDEVVLFDGGYLGEEVIATYKFRLVGANGYISSEKSFIIKNDQKIPALTSITPARIEGYPAYGKDVTIKSTDVNYLHGSFSYNKYRAPGDDGPVGFLGYSNIQDIDIRTIKLTENGYYQYPTITDGMGTNWNQLGDIYIDKAVPVLPVVTSAQMVPGVPGSPVIVTLDPSIEDGHSYKLQYSLDNVLWTDFAAGGNPNAFIIYPKNGVKNTDKYYFRAVNAKSGNASSVRSYTANIAEGPLVMFGDIARQVQEGGVYEIGVQANVSDIRAWVDGEAQLTFVRKGVTLADGDKLTAGQPIYGTLTYGDGNTVQFTVNVNTTRPVFGLSAVTTASGGPTYTKGSWVKDNVKLTITANNPQLAATYYYSIDDGATWRKITLKADGTYTFAVNCTADAELERTYRFKSAADSGTAYGEISYAVKIDKVPLTAVALNGSIADGKTAYSSAVTLVANKAATYDYAFTAPGGAPVSRTAGSVVLSRSLGDSGSYTNVIARDKVGNMLAVQDFVIAKKPDLSVEFTGDTATLSVTNTVPEDLLLEYYSASGKVWTAMDSNTFVADQTQEYRFRATNNLSGAVSAVVKITLTV